MDDALDYTSRADTSGKPLGGDLREGKFTLPLLLYLESLPEDQREIVTRELTDVNLHPVRQDQIIADVVGQGFAEKTRNEAQSYLALASQALAVLPECLEKKLLGAMIEFVLTRDK